MKRCLVMLTAAAALWAISTPRAEATLIFNFDADNGGAPTLNWNGNPDWTVSGGTVDLIGNGYFDFLPGNGLYIDLDGSTGNAADAFSHTFLGLGAGSYVLSFDLAGNHRNGAYEAVTVSFGSYLETFDSITFTMGVPFTTITRVVTVGDSPTLSFGSFGGDNVGLLLDNVTVSAVPEPATLILLGAGLAGLGLRRRRRG